MVKILKGEQSLRGAAAVVGVGLSRFGDLSGNSHMEIMGEAVHHALADAGLTIERFTEGWLKVEEQLLSIEHACGLDLLEEGLS